MKATEIQVRTSPLYDIPPPSPRFCDSSPISTAKSLNYKFNLPAKKSPAMMASLVSLSNIY